MLDTSKKHQLSVRFTPDQLRLIDEVAALRGCDRPEAIRHVVQFGAPLILKLQGVNLNRILMVLEILVVDCLRKTGETDAKAIEVLVDSAAKNVRQYHV